MAERARFKEDKCLLHRRLDSDYVASCEAARQSSRNRQGSSGGSGKMMGKKASSGTKRWIDIGGTQTDKKRWSKMLASLVASVRLLCSKPHTHTHKNLLCFISETRWRCSYCTRDIVLTWRNTKRFTLVTYSVICELLFILIKSSNVIYLSRICVYWLAWALFIFRMPSIFVLIYERMQKNR